MNEVHIKTLTGESIITVDTSLAGTYLALAGGTMTGSIDFSGAAAVTMSNPFFAMMGSYTGINAGGYGSSVNQSNLEIDNDQGFTTNINSSIGNTLVGKIEVVKNNLGDWQQPLSQDALPIGLGSNLTTYKVGIYNSVAVGMKGGIVKTANTGYVKRLAFNGGEAFETGVENTTPTADRTVTLPDADMNFETALTEVLTFGGGGSGDVATMTVSNGIIVSTTKVP